MPGNPGKFIKFWRELKRRKVFGVVTTYAATAYIIIEVTNNLVDSLHLPDWIGPVVVLLLAIGLPVAVILSWIFDFTPEGITKTESIEESSGKEITAKPFKRKLRPSYVLNAVLIIAVVVLVYPRIFKPDTLKRLASSGERIAIAVMPFQNLTNDTTWNVYQHGIQGSLISYLSNVEELKVRQKESINTLLENNGVTEHASLSPSVAGLISKKLDADIFILGSINKAGAMLRIDAQLIDTKTKDVFKSFELNRPFNEKIVFDITDSLRKKIKDFLQISKLIKENPGYERYPPSTTSPEAFRYYLYGNNAFVKADWPASIEWSLKALAIDSTYIEPMFTLSMAYGNQFMVEQSFFWLFKLYKQRDQMAPNLQLWVNYLYACSFESLTEQLGILKQLQEIDDQDISLGYSMGKCYMGLDQFDKAITEYKKTLEIVHRTGQKDSWAYASLGEAYHLKGEYRKEKKIYKKAEKYYVDHNSISFSWVVKDQAILSFALKDSVAANQYIEKYRSILKENSWSGADIAMALAAIYSQANVLDKAETHYRKSLSLEPGKPDRMNALAWFLIDKERNINEGLELIDKTLAISPGNYSYLDTKGWGLYKSGKYQEALDLFQNLWDSAPYKMYFMKSHLEEVRKAFKPSLLN